MAKLASETTDKLIGRHIQMRKKELGMTAQQLSEHADISQQQLSRYERGANKINVAHLVNIAIKMDTSIGWFFICCFDEKSSGNNVKTEFVPVRDVDLKNRFEQVWPRLTHGQRKVLILLLDEYT